MMGSTIDENNAIIQCRAIAWIKYQETQGHAATFAGTGTHDSLSLLSHTSYIPDGIERCCVDESSEAYWIFRD